MTHGLKVNNKGQSYPMNLKLLPTANASEGEKYTTKLNPNSQMGMGLTAQAMNGLLPTPMATDVYHQERVSELKKKNVSFHSRANGDSRPNGLMDYLDFNNLLPTPTAIDSSGATAKMKSSQVKDGSMHSMTLSRLVLNGENTQKTTGQTFQLNPRYVAEMMGFPIDWTELPFQNGEANP